MKKWFNSLKISRKIIGGFLVVSIISAIIGIAGIYSVITVNQSNIRLYQENTLGLQYAGNAAVDFQQLRYDMLKLRKTEGSAQHDIDTQVTATKESSDTFGATLKDFLILGFLPVE